MVFSSALFLFYFLPVFLVTYYLVPGRYKNLTLLLFSIFFYAWGAPRFIFIMLGSTLITYYLINGMHGASSKNRRKMLLVIALLVNIGILVYFKYANFFLENVSELMLRFGFKELGWMRIALPIGISFYTFQSLSHTALMYIVACVNPLIVRPISHYIIMFPQLIAGPIVRFNTIASQIRSRQEDDADRLTGFIRFSIGLAKKVLIANVMGRQADLIMGGDIQALGSGAAWLGLMAYSFQIYFDFAGYSDMAIGIGRMIGFRFPENFNNPYVSVSITEFWRRWHMTLSAWMRDYLYIPLGGNRVKTRGRLFFNLWVVFLISGLWHGAAWNFIIWGGYHGLFLVLDRLFLKKVLDGIGRVPAMLFTFFVATLGWVVFRIESLPDAMNFYGKLFAFDFGRLDILSNLEFSITLVPAIFFSFITMFRIGRRWEQMVYFEPHSPVRMAWLGSISILLFVLSVGSITASGSILLSISGSRRKMKRPLKISYILLLVLLSLPLIQHVTGLFRVIELKGDIKEAEPFNFSINRWFDEGYQEEAVEFLNEQFGFRNSFIRINNQVAFSLFRKALANGVDIGKDNYLFERNYIRAYYGQDFLGDSLIRERVARLKQLQDQMGKGKLFFIAFAAGKGSYFPEYFPRYLLSGRGITNLEVYIEECERQGVNFIDLNGWFLEMKDTAEYPLFPQTGIHWSYYGMCLTADSLIRYMEQGLARDITDFSWDRITTSRRYRSSDNDIEKGMNMIFRIARQPYAYPEINYNETGKYKPRFIVIADSYYWGLHNMGITNRVFKEGEFWFYNRGIYATHRGEVEYVKEVNARERLERADIIMLMVTEATLPRFPYGFGEMFSETYLPNGD